MRAEFLKGTKLSDQQIAAYCECYAGQHAGVR
jgi:hypothetical protein